MSPFLFDADLAATTQLADKRRANTSVGDAKDAYIASLFTDYGQAISQGRYDDAALIRDHAGAIDRSLLAELDGFNFPAAA
jgi:hypothetical protein